MACEKCWSDAYRRSYFNPEKTQADYYTELLEERKDNPCTLDEQRGFRYRGADNGEEEN